MRDGERGDYISFPDGGMIATEPGGSGMNKQTVAEGFRDLVENDRDGRQLAENICHEAGNAIGPGKDRERSHGPMESSFLIAANLWTAYLGFDVTPGDVAACMAMLKYSRIKTGDPTRKDHYVDIAGYAGLQGALANAK
jgi:hypothetical protein